MTKNGGPSAHRAESGYNVALVGASSLKGKEIKEILQERHFPVSRLALLDAEEVGGLLTEFDEEPAIIYPVSGESFEDISIVLFASSPAFTQKHWQMAEGKGCEIIDLSYYLEANPQARLRAPALERLREEGNLSPARRLPETRISVVAHPVAIAIAGILVQLSRRFGVERSAITVCEPVSEHGKAGVDELHRQTVNLLAFQKITHQVFDSQVAFNLTAGNAEQSRPSLREVQQRIRSHVAGLLAGCAPQPALRVLQAPIFYGHAFSCFVELKEQVSTEAVEEALDRKPLSVWRDPEAVPSVVSVAGSEDVILGHIERDPATDSGYWVWGVLDNLRFCALNAVEIAESLLKSSVQ
jgi:aspartate-semialdehyde dehydrogenase